jgi:hypothetical protein
VSFAASQEDPVFGGARARTPGVCPARRVVTLLLPLHPFAPFRDQRTVLSPIGRLKSRPGPAGDCRSIWHVMVRQRGTLSRTHTRAFSPPPLAFARLGPDRSFTRPFQIHSGALGIWDGRHEARFAPINAQAMPECKLIERRGRYGSACHPQMTACCGRANELIHYTIL